MAGVGDVSANIVTSSRMMDLLDLIVYLSHCITEKLSTQLVDHCLTMIMR